MLRSRWFQSAPFGQRRYVRVKTAFLIECAPNDFCQVRPAERFADQQYTGIEASVMNDGVFEDDLEVEQQSRCFGCQLRRQKIRQRLAEVFQYRKFP